MKASFGKIMRTSAALLALGSLFAVGAAQAQDPGRRDGFAAKLGFDLPGSLDVKVSDVERTDDMKSGYSGALELVWGGRKALAFGVGVLGQASRRIDAGLTNRTLGFLAGYGLVNLALPLRASGFGTYATARFGYSYPLADDAFKASLGDGVSLSGDIYWGASVGAIIGDLILLEAAYNALHGEAEWDERVEEFEYRQFTLSVGFQF